MLRRLVVFMLSCLIATQASSTIITYQWNGTITYNDGIPDFPLGATASGFASWDTDATPNNTGFFASPAAERYAAGTHLFTFTSAGVTISSTGLVYVDVTTTALGGFFDNFSVVSEDAIVPAGWSIDHTSVSDSYGLVLQGNSNPFPSDSLPLALVGSDWSFRQVSLDFFHGVTTPNGIFSERRLVLVNIESLAVAPNGPVAIEDATWSALKSLYRG